MNLFFDIYDKNRPQPKKKRKKKRIQGNRHKGLFADSFLEYPVNKNRPPNKYCYKRLLSFNIAKKE